MPRLALREPLSLPERLLSALQSVRDKLAAAARKVRNWLRKLLLPSGPRPTGDAATVARAAIAFVALALASLVVLALRSLRQARTPASEVEMIASPVTDEDPLSRESSQWESRARELAGAQRFREAIRAWYHAVLTALFRRGTLHYRRGRTNWEYVASVGPEQGWRAGFIALTRLFDREWYGSRSSDREAFAVASRQAQEILAALGRARELR